MYNIPFLKPNLSDEEDATIANYVIIDKVKEMEEPSQNKLNIWGDFCRPLHLLKVIFTTMCLGFAFIILINWNDILSLHFGLGILLIQLIFTVDTFPGMRLNTRSYLSGPTINATLEETKIKKRKFFHGPKRTHYVVLYNTINDGRTMLIRKILQAGFFDDDLPQNTASNNALTDLVCREGAPFSAFPKAAVWKHHLRYRTWVLYFLPILLLTIASIAYNLYFSFHVEWGRKQHIALLRPIFITYGVLYVIILSPLIYVVRRWKYDVSYGGDEINGIAMPNASV
jgi:hypothetical protein